jgi:hypothetical protein
MIEWALGVVYLCALPVFIVGGVVYALFIGIPLMMYDTVSSVWKLLK